MIFLGAAGSGVMENREGELQAKQADSQVQFSNAVSSTSSMVASSSSAAAAADGILPERVSSGRGGPARDPKLCGVLHSLISQSHACRYEFAEYFVAWQGVLTVAFSGIPPAISLLKRSIDLQLGACVQVENPGSKWPKVSLGCLRDGATLSLDQLRRLRQICTEETPRLAALQPILVDDLSVVLYANCCLEDTIAVTTTPLAFPADFSRPDSDEIALVQGVLDEFALENVERYHKFTSKAGNRSAHYRNSKAGATLVHFLKSVPAVLAGLRARVDSDLPGVYDWFRDDSLHITVRALF